MYMDMYCGSGVNSKFFTEFDNSEHEGGLQRQADEADADGYAVYLCSLTR